ncbi:MAG: response regulator transcription factor [Methylophaga sp.]|nr:response regulator transcription factor [Methylophaga sp.]
MKSKSITVLLVDDHAVVREGYRSFLEKQKGIKVIAEAESGEEAYRLFKEIQPNVVVMDLSLPGRGGIETIARIRKQSATVRMLVFSMHQNPTFALQAIKAGARGYVTKNSLPSVLVQAIHDVSAGKIALSHDIAEALAVEKLEINNTALEELTSREFEIFNMILDAKSVSEIADTLCVTQKTISNCHYIIKKKLGTKTDIELIHFAIKMNIFKPLNLVPAS